jgi:hypothetical protein
MKRTLIISIIMLIALASLDAQDTGKKGKTVTWFVDVSSRVKNPDGGAGAPFSSLTSAIAAGKRLTPGTLILCIAPGEYDAEDLGPRFSLTLQGWDPKRAGTFPDLKSKVIINNSRIAGETPITLTIKNLTVRGSTLTVDHRDARLLLNNVLVQGGKGAGILVRTGKLKLEKVTIEKTEAIGDGSPDDGAGLVLAGGTGAVLTDLQLRGNSNGGLRIADKGTKVYGNRVTVADNKAVTPSVVDRYEPGIGAVEVRGGALLLLENAVIEANALVGLMIRDGGNCHIRDSEIRGTKGIRINRKTNFGANIVVLTGTRSSSSAQKTILEFARITSTAADSFGMQVIDSYVYGSESEIKGNTIGLALAAPLSINTPDLDSCFSGTTLYNNEVNYSADFLPLPDPGAVFNPADAETTNTTCGRVPFDTTFTRW